MAKWNVHYSGYYAYDVEVEANTEDEAIEKADGYEPIDEEYKYEPDRTEAWEV